MTRIVASAALAAAILGGASDAGAANKEQQLLMAELRMLQQQQQQLQQLIVSLADSLKAVTGRLDDQATTSRKALADQRLLIEGMTDNVRILRERADDTNVRLASITQELESIRRTIAAQQQMTLPAGGDPGTTAPNAAAGDPSGGAPVAVPPNISPQRTWDTAYSDYTAGHYEIAIEGFETFLKFFPRHINADDAHLYIGNAHFNAGKFQEAIASYQRVVSDYPEGDTVPAAHYKIGLAHLELKQPDQARKAFEVILSNFDASVSEYMLARQALERVK